jgi:hypothetical protein
VDHVASVSLPNFIQANDSASKEKTVTSLRQFFDGSSNLAQHILPTKRLTLSVETGHLRHTIFSHWTSANLNAQQIR